MSSEKYPRFGDQRGHEDVDRAIAKMAETAFTMGLSGPAASRLAGLCYEFCEVELRKHDLKGIIEGVIR